MITHVYVHNYLFKGKYDDKASKAEMLLGRFGLQLGDNNQLPWVLTKEKLQLAQQRLKHLLILILILDICSHIHHDLSHMTGSR